MAQFAFSKSQPDAVSGTHDRSAADSPAHRRVRAQIAVVLLLIAVAIIPRDNRILATCTGLDLGGDLRRELELLQQFGAPASVLIVLALVALLDPRRTRRLLDWAAAALLTWITVFGLKLLLGRPRPVLDEPTMLLGPFRSMSVRPDAPAIHAWNVTADDVERLWSMPSSHTAFATVLGIFLAVVYPKLRPFAFVMIAVVGACRVIFGAHYLSDVLVGFTVAWLISVPAVRGMWGVRALDAFWTRFIDPDNVPAYPRMVQLEQQRRED